jgi:hypothetical protein
MKKLLAIPVLAVTALVGLAMGITFMVNAQTPTPTTTPTTTTAPATTSVPETTSPATVTTPGPTGHHAPLGGDGNVTAINGSIITMTEEADEGGAAYTVDASGATITNNGTAAQLSDIKVGDKIFVKGTVNGTNVIATQISTGFGGGNCSKTESN